MNRLFLLLMNCMLVITHAQLYIYVNRTVPTRVKRYNIRYDIQWRDELRMRETESLREYIKLRTEPETLQEHQYYRKLPSEARHRWFYQEFGNYVGFFLALILFTVHHTGAIIFFALSWLCNKRKLYITAGKLKTPRHVGTRAHYEELQLVPTKDLRAEVYAVTQITPRDDNYIPCETMDSIEKLIRETSFYSMATSVAKSMQFDQTPVPVEGVLPFNKIGFAGPYGERIVERGRPIRDALPGEATPIVFDIDEIPFSVIGQNGFAGLVELVRENTVIIKTDRTANGCMRGYLGGRFAENKD